MVNSKLFTGALLALIYLGQPNLVIGQDVNHLSMRARINLYETWHFDSVAYYFDRVIGEKNTPAFAYSDYGWYLMLVDRYNEGLDYIQRAAEMSPSDKQLVAWNSWALLWEGEFTKAKQWIGKSLAIDPEYGEALHVSSRIASAMGNNSEAIRMAEKAASVDPNWRAMIPLALAKAGKKELALSWAEKIATNENVSDVWLLMEVYAHLGYEGKALDYLQKSFELKYPFMPWLKLAPGIVNLHDNTRFKDIV